MMKIALGKKARKHKGLIALVDDEDYESVNQFNWYASYYPQRKKYIAQRHEFIGDKSQRSIQMHRWLTSATYGARVVHLNGDTLDNRRNNLKVVRAGQEEEHDDKVEDGDNLDV